MAKIIIQLMSHPSAKEPVLTRAMKNPQRDAVYSHKGETYVYFGSTVSGGLAGSKRTESWLYSRRPVIKLKSQTGS